MRFRFVHAADLHLDTPFSGLGQLAPDLADRLRDASLTALDRVVAEALRVDAAFVVLAGDIYDGPERGTRAQLHLRTALARLAREGIPTFIAHGNHDPEGGHYTAVRTWPEGVVRFAPGAPQRHPVTRAGAHLATVHGVSYATRHTPDNLALTFPRVDSPGFHVAVLHCNVGGDHPGHANYAPCSLDDLRSRGMNYWALGHVHRHKVLARDPWVVYPGNTQGRSLAAGELGPKGAVVVEVEDDRVLDLRPFTTDSARFFDLAVSIADLDDLGALTDRLRDAADALRDDNPDVALLLRATLTGRGPLHRAIKDLVGREELRASLDDGASDLWWLALEDAAAPPLDYAQLRHGGDLRAAVLETADAWRAALPADLLDELRAAGGDLDPDVLRALLDAATHDVLDRLSPEPA